MNIRAAARPLRFSAILTIASLITLGWVLLAPDDGSVANVSESHRSALVSERAIVVADTTPDDLIAEAVARDPFRIDEASAASAASTGPETSKDQQPLRVIGTVVDSLGGSFALCQLGGAQAVLLRIGQKIGEYELRAIEPASVVFTTADGGRVERRIQRART
jgi:hypothetical protein